uniref:Uncharacterized protein n=1 Tax=Desertifilum tharense IPPAS B-1220 TaxID=1781255 RepID=A0ACD5GW57_9CYAN
MGRSFEPGELGREYKENSTTIEVLFAENPNWEILVFVLAKLEQENRELSLKVQSFMPQENHFLLRLSANYLVNSKILGERILELYTEMQPLFMLNRPKILHLLKISQNNHRASPPVPPPTMPQPGIDKRQQLYQEVSKQIRLILLSQEPEQFVESVQRLLNYLKQQGIALEELQRKLIVNLIVQRGRQDSQFRDNLLIWEKQASETAKLSMVGQAVKVAIALLWYSNHVLNELALRVPTLAPGV